VSGSARAKVLLIDVDPQGNTTSGLGVDKASIKRCVYDCLVNDAPMEEVAIATNIENLSLLPATIQLAGAEIELVAVLARENMLKRALEKVNIVIISLLWTVLLPWGC